MTKPSIGKILAVVCFSDPGDFFTAMVDLSFKEGASVGYSTCTDIEILNDAILESIETFTVILMAFDVNVTKISTAFSSATVTILEDSTDCKFVKGFFYLLVY